MLLTSKAFPCGLALRLGLACSVGRGHRFLLIPMWFTSQRKLWWGRGCEWGQKSLEFPVGCWGLIVVEEPPPLDSTNWVRLTSLQGHIGPPSGLSGSLSNGRSWGGQQRRKPKCWELPVAKRQFSFKLCCAPDLGTWGCRINTPLMGPRNRTRVRCFPCMANLGLC